MSGRLSPRLSDIRYVEDMFLDGRVMLLSDAAFRALLLLVSQTAAGLVWTYSAPGDGSFPDDDTRIARIIRMSPQRWKKIRPEVEPFFKIRRGRWFLNEEWICVETTAARPALPTAIQDTVKAREGRVCTYCGGGGPFDFDHIFPVSRGGSSHASNLTLACASCNRSKGARTLREWMADRG